MPTIPLQNPTNFQLHSLASGDVFFFGWAAESAETIRPAYPAFYTQMGLCNGGPKRYSFPDD